VKDNFINDLRVKATGHWQPIFERLGIPTNRSEGPCPACGGSTRYRFDDKDGRGTYFCSHCGAGTGLDLVMKVRQCGAREAAVMVAEVMALPLPEQKPAREKPQTDIASKVARLAAKTAPGQSDYLTSKGLQRPFPLLSDGSMLITLTNVAGAITGAQVIKPDGSKRLVAGTVKKGSFCVVNSVENTETVVISEGLATALSVQELRQIATVIAAIDAGNLPAVAMAMRQRYPNAQIIIAADNDQSSESDGIEGVKVNTGKEAAEKAAKAVSGWVSMPPVDYKADWNDYHQQYGLEAATAAFNASMYQPEGKKVGATLTAIDGGKKSPGIDDDLKPRVESRSDGIHWITPKVDKDTGEIINTEAWLCSPLEIAGAGSDNARQRFLILRWDVPGNRGQVTRALPWEDIGDREGWRTLKNGGVSVTTKPSLRAILADWLQRTGSGKEWQISHTTGWHSGAYIMPDGDVIGEPEIPLLFSGRSAAAGGYTVSGTPESWRDSVARLALGNPSMMLGVAAALSAPLIGLVGADGFGVHLFEQSSAGKTTTANIASSLYGEPDALRLTWYGTALGIANEAEAHNDSLLPLDEVGQGSSAKDVATSAYTLFNGAGKLQGAKEGGNRELKRWRTVAISTGEMDIETFLSAGGLKVKAGQLVRLLNLPMEKSVAHHEYQNGKQHADALKEAYQTNHGAAGREWIKWLAGHQQEAKQAVRAAQERWRSLIPADYGEQVHRVGERFAILEAALVLGMPVTGWGEQESRDAIQHGFNAWVKSLARGTASISRSSSRRRRFLMPTA
jgi:putative DNA primase/helicase